MTDNKPMDGSAEELVKAVSELLGVPVDELTSRSRRRRYVRARQIVAHIGHTVLHITQSDLAAIIGRERTGVGYLCKVHEFDYKHDEQYRTCYNTVLTRCTWNL